MRPYPDVDGAPVKNSWRHLVIYKEITQIMGFMSKRDVARLRKESMRLLGIQWRTGPLRGHRGCSIGNRAVDDALRVHTRCNSDSCRPGDPFGCSMARARLHRSKCELILNGWVENGRTAWLGVLEVTASPQERLKNVLTSTQMIFEKPFANRPWAREKEAYGIGGRFSTTEVTMTTAGGWIVRRWVVLASERELAEPDIDKVSARLHEMWLGAHPKAETKSLILSAHGLVEIDRQSVQSVSQRMSACVSAMDPMDETHWYSLRSRLNLAERPERSAASLAHDYRSAAHEIPFDRLNNRYARYAKREELEMPESGHYFWFAIEQERGVARLRFTPPAACAPFMEYAVTMKSRDQFKALPARRTSSDRWQRLIDEAGALKMDTVGSPGMRPAASTVRRK